MMSRGNVVNDKTIKLSIGDKCLLVGNMLTVLGGTLVGIGTIFRLADGPNGLPSGRAVFTSAGSEAPKPINIQDVAGSYFNI